MGVFDKAKDFIHSEEVEEKSDAVLDKAEDLATEKLGADKADTIAKVRNTACRVEPAQAPPPFGVPPRPAELAAAGWESPHKRQCGDARGGDSRQSQRDGRHSAHSSAGPAAVEVFLPGDVSAEVVSA